MLAQSPVTSAGNTNPAGSEAGRVLLLEAIKAGGDASDLRRRRCGSARPADALLRGDWPAIKPTELPAKAPLTQRMKPRHVAIAAPTPSSRPQRRTEACAASRRGHPGDVRCRVWPRFAKLWPSCAGFHAEKETATYGVAGGRTLRAASRIALASTSRTKSPQSRATQIYRESHPEANYASRARVIYPTTRAQRDAIRSRHERVAAVVVLDGTFIVDRTLRVRMPHAERAVNIRMDGLCTNRKP